MSITSRIIIRNSRLLNVNSTTLSILRSSPQLLFRPISTSPFLLQSSPTSFPPSPSSPIDLNQSHQEQDQQQQQQQPIKKKSSPTALFYRNLVPSMLHCLALGSIIYYSLELLHNYLDSELIKEELEIKIMILESELEGLRKGVEEGGRESGSWWKSW